MSTQSLGPVRIREHRPARKPASAPAQHAGQQTARHDPPGHRSPYTPQHSRHEEQRIKSRFRAHGLSVTLNRRRCLGLMRWSLKTRCLDINRYGVALVSPAPLPRGTRISLDFQGQYITQSGVQAEVVTRAPASGGGYRLGIRFLYCAYRHAYCRRLDNALSRIEAMYRQKARKQTP
ncbi:MAG: hypothetical protein R3296_05920 [Oleiphilaceae bacterium]|nr:hypothetical protein [Oleiphilaceae bacterium]